MNIKEVNGVKMCFTKEEMNSLLFYQGSVKRIFDFKGTELEKFYQVEDAYNVLNTLLFPGIENERARLGEGKNLNQCLLHHIPELLEVYCNIYSAMCKYTFWIEKERELCTKRADREYSLDGYQIGESYSFLSTTSKGKVDEYFCKKKGLILLDIEAAGDIEHIDLNEVLYGTNEYQEEEEILYAPFLFVDLYKTDLNASEKLLRDCEGNPPAGKYKLLIKASQIGETWKNHCGYENLGELFQSIIVQKEVDNALYIWDMMSKGKCSDADKEIQYAEWKSRLQDYLKGRFVIIKDMIRNGGNKTRLDMLKTDISVYKQSTNVRREKYDKQLQGFNIAISIIQPLIAVFLAFSFVDGKNLQIMFKVLGTLAAGSCVILDKICGALGLKGKLEQRTWTYLRLDELEMDIKYETLIDERKLEEFVNRFKSIIVIDDKNSEDNLQRIIRNFDDLVKENPLNEKV